MTKNQRVLVVLGMDRSGTSLCANVLQVLGMSLGTDLLPADRFNERGYFEDREIWRVHERVLAVMGRSWDTLATVLPFQPRWWQSQPMEKFRNQLVEIARKRIAVAGPATWGFKDPRTVLLLPLWEGVFQDLGLDPIFIVCVRHPGAVAQSLAARDSFPPLISELLWVEKTLAACLESWNADNCLIHYEDWFIQPWRSIETLIEVTGLTPPLKGQELNAAVASIVSREMRHDREGSLHIQSRVAADLYGYLLDYARVPERQILRGFETALAVAGEFISGVEEMAGRKLPCSGYAPSYMHCTAEDMELIQKDSSGAAEIAQWHYPSLIRAQRLLADRDAQLIELTEALAHAQALLQERDTALLRHAEALVQAQHLVDERDTLLQRHVEALVQAQRLVAERDTLLQRHMEGLAHAERLVIERDAELERYADALADAERVVAELNRQLRGADVLREQT